MAWETPDIHLITLCRQCHERAHGLLPQENYGQFFMTNPKYLRYATLQAYGALATLFTLTWLIEQDNIVYTSHAKLAIEIGKSLPTIARHMGALREANVVIRDTNARIPCYLIHPLVAWVGTIQSRNMYIDGLGTAHPFIKVIEQVEG